ncbi:unnamed protein product [Prunus brigantina]
MILLHVLGQGKRGYLTWKVAQVEEDALSFDSWGIEDSIVKGWLLKTMEPDLVELFLDLPIAKDMYYDTSDDRRFMNYGVKQLVILKEVAILHPTLLSSRPFG